MKKKYDLRFGQTADGMDAAISAAADSAIVIVDRQPQAVTTASTSQAPGIVLAAATPATPTTAVLPRLVASSNPAVPKRTFRGVPIETSLTSTSTKQPAAKQQRTRPAEQALTKPPAPVKSNAKHYPEGSRMTWNQIIYGTDNNAIWQLRKYLPRILEYFRQKVDLQDPNTRSMRNDLVSMIWIFKQAVQNKVRTEQQMERHSTTPMEKKTYKVLLMFIQQNCGIPESPQASEDTSEVYDFSDMSDEFTNFTANILLPAPVEQESAEDAADSLAARINQPDVEPNDGEEEDKS